MRKDIFIATLILSALMLTACSGTDSGTSGKPSASDAKPVAESPQVSVAVSDSAGTSVSASSTSVTASAVALTYSLADIAAHNSGDNCWMALDGKVFDVSKYTPKHPGGEAILQGCGKDATEMFKGVPHSDKATAMLGSFYIGDLR
jgi:cytochrome b involved in lipid metabolism